MKGTKVKYLAIFSEIKRQTGLRVWANEEISNKIAKSISFENTPLEDVMGKLLPATYTWQIRGNELLISKIGQGQSVGESPKTNTDLSKANVADTANLLVDISGSVTDEKGNPIPGATILIKGQNKGTISGSNGTFNIKGVSPNAILTVSNVSFLTKDVAVRGRASLGAIALTQVEKKLDDVVVLAYSKTTNRLLTGNVSSVKAKDIQNSPVNNPMLAVAGRIPGITISQATGFAGSGVDIVVQGLNSMQKGSAPFYVIDGVPYVQSLLPNLGNILRYSGRGSGDGTVTGSPLAFINPADIESIEVLKDADATAIYGSRAANGAIIITTKRGKEGQMKVDINLQKGFGQVARRLKLMHTKQYLAMRREAKLNDGSAIGSRDYDINGTWDTLKNTDWQKELIGGKANYTDVQLGVSGGNYNTQYWVAGTYHKETTVFPTDLNDSKISLRMNLDASSKDKRFRMNLSTGYLADNNKLPALDLTENAMTLSPNMPDILTPDGKVNWAPNSVGRSTISSNPIALLNTQYLNKTSNLIGNGAFSYSLWKGLVAKVNLGYNRLHSEEISKTPLSTIMPELRSFLPRTSNFGFNDISSWIAEPQILYSAKIAQGELNTILGGAYQQSNSDRKVLFASGFANDEVLNNISAATTISTSPLTTIISQYKYAAAFMQLNYNWKNRYIINLSGRRDGSSRFGSENRYHTFGSMGLAWVFTEEEFMQNIGAHKHGLLSFGKLKFSYGTTGNDQIGDYGYLTLYQNNNGDVPYRGGASLTVNRLSNSRLQWEETRKLSIGLDLGLMDDRVFINGVYYRNRSSNMLVGAIIPSTAGPTSGLLENLPALIQNQGLELAIGSTNIRNSVVTWSTNFNITIPQNKILSFGSIESTNYANSLIIGHPVNYVKLYRSAGVNSTTGIYQFLDKDGKLTDNPTSDPNNYIKFINPSQTFYGGLSNSLSFKGFTFDFLFQFVKQMGKNEPYSQAPGARGINQLASASERWQHEGDLKPVQKYSITNADFANAFFYQLFSDAYWEDASYIRLKNISLSYSIPTGNTLKSRIQSCRIYLNAQNVATITSYGGLDPESLSNFTLPPLRVFTFGIQAIL